MKCTRRDLGLLLPAIIATNGRTQNVTLTSRAYRFADLAVRGSAEMRSRQILRGKTHTNFAIDLHHTELAAGAAPHPPHQHVHEELLLIQEGTLDVLVAGETRTLGPGSVAYFASNQKHGWRNSGTGTAQYFVLALGEDQA